MKSRAEIAVKFFNAGFNCSQSVLAVFCEDYGMEKELALRMSCGLGGGFRSGEVCGAVSGAVIVIGLKYGQFIAEDKESKSNCYAKTVEFINMFREKNSSVICRELLGCDISSKEGFEKAHKNNLFKTTCVEMIVKAVAILENLGY